MTTSMKERPAANGHAITGANPGKALKRLHELHGQAGPNIYERIRLASELLANRQWVESQHTGDEAKAGDWLQEQYFQDIGGLISVYMMRSMYDALPESTWKEYKYNLKALRWEYQERTRLADKDSSGNSGRRSVKVADFEKKEQEVKELEYKVKKTEESQASKEEIIRQQQQEIHRLQLENERLKGRIEELERQMRPAIAVA